MPKIALHSDLHREFFNSNDGRHRWFWHDNVTYKNKPSADNADVVVLAGDILAGNNSFDFLKTFCDRFPDVIHVAGNHEFYNVYYEEMLERLRDFSAKVSNYHFLERETLTLDGQRYVGCTMWYVGNITRDEPMNDFRCIKVQNGRWGQFVFDYAAESVQWLYDTVEASDVVITHMLPCYSAVEPSWLSSLWNAYYYNDGDKVINDKRPKLWLHGHSHGSMDRMLGDTRIVRNPRGYPGELNHNWQPNLRIST